MLQPEKLHSASNNLYTLYYRNIVGAVIVGGIIEGILGLLARYWIRLITPIVSSTVVTAIGFSLLSVGASSFGGGSGSDSFGSATETIGDTSALAASGLNREASLKETSGSIACDGFISALSGLFGCMPITSFSQNVGLVAMTKVVNRFAIATGAIIMILAGIFPFFGSVLATLPDAVLGGCTLMMFGNIVISGLQMMGKAGFTQRNITIAALSLSVGIGFTQVPEIFAIFPQIIQTVFAENCVAVVFIVSIILNLVLPKNMEATTK